MTKAGAGTGTVTSSPTGIDCGSTCVATYSNGTTVTLTARAGTRARFQGWSGDCSGRSTCVLTMTANHTVKATFAKALTPSACVVPNVVGKKLGAATRAIVRAHCKVGTIARSRAAARKKGKVLRQSPAAGRHLRNGSKVSLTLGK